MDECLRCPICRELFQAAVIISNRKCGHTFCSECIRTTFRVGITGVHRVAQCPECRFEVPKNKIDDMLVPNRAMQEAVLQYRRMNKLPETHDGSTASKAAEEGQSQSEGVERRSRRSARSGSGSVNYNENDGDDAQTKATEGSDLYQKRPSLNYAGMKRKKLQELCAKDGLSTDGTEAQLKARHQQFVTLWNSERDSIVPRSKEELVRYIQDNERAAKREQCLGYQAKQQSRLMENVKRSREEMGKEESELATSTETAAPVTTRVTSGNIAFDEEMNRRFREMIKSVKERKQREKEKLGIQPTKPLSKFVESSCSTGTDPIGSVENDSAETTSADSTSGGIVASQAPKPSGSVPVPLPVPSRKRTADHVISISDDSPPKSGPPSAPLVKAKKSKLDSFFSASDAGPWSCTKCTFYNTKRTRASSRCEICMNGRSGPLDKNNKGTVNSQA